MPRCYSNKIAKQLYSNRTLAWVLSCKFALCFQNTFSSEHLWRAAAVHDIFVIYRIWIYLTSFKKKLWRRRFPVNFKNAFFTEHLVTALSFDIFSLSIKRNMLNQT